MEGVFAIMKVSISHMRYLKDFKIIKINIIYSNNDFEYFYEIRITS